jgi:L-lactate dehydrogenase complex protein LldG
VALFADRARQVGVRVEIAASIQEAAALAAGWCLQRGARRAAVWATPDLSPVVEHLRFQGVEILPPGTPTDVVAQADAGVTGAECGIAETGTLVLPCDTDRPRLASLLPPAHLAVLSADRILPDLPALFARLGPLPSALALITGPGRSADIGLVPTVGAHGPFEVAVVIVRGESGP